VVEQDQDIHWIEVKFVCKGELAEALADLLGRFVSNGVVVENVTRFNPHTQENEPTGAFEVSGYLPVDDQLPQKRQKLTEALWHMGQISPLPEPQYRPIIDQDWMAAWKQHYKPIPLGERFLILPAWEELPEDGSRIVIRINPAMAFGTGTHPTTQLCLGLLEQHYQPGQSVIDVGCGSGILSIAANKLGAPKVLAVDVDSQSVISTKENAALNIVPQEALEIGHGSIGEILSGKFEIQSAPIVLVNILASIILRLFDQGLARAVTDRGVLLLSGILEHQEDEIGQKAQENGFMVIDKLTQKDWISLALQKS